MTSPANFPDQVDDGLSDPRPRAVAYICIPSGYDHAEAQWRQELSEKAEAEGYVIERWYVDPGLRDDGLSAMLTHLHGSGIQAIFVPDMTHLEPIHRRGGLYGDIPDISKEDLARVLNRHIFVLSERFARITLPGATTLTEPTPAPAQLQERGPRWWRSWFRPR